MGMELNTHENRMKRVHGELAALDLILIEPHLGRMDPGEKEEWCSALLSGKYPQGRQMLKTPDGSFCCLGVRCEIADVPHYDALADLQGSANRNEYVEVTHFGDTDHGSYTFVPHGYEITLYDEEDGGPIFYFNGGTHLFTAWTQGSPEEGPTFEVAHRENHSLPSLNDGGFTFAQIADVIRYFL